MTVIFHTNAGAPVLAGDMLISVPTPIIHTNLKLPSQPNGITIPSGMAPNYIPIMMRRKIFIVNDHLAVGGAGSAQDVAQFVDDINKEFRDRIAFTRMEIETFLDQYFLSQNNQEASQNIAAIVLAEATDWCGSLTKSLSNHRNIVTQQFGRIIAIGTGSNTTIDQVLRLDNNYKWGMSQPPDGGKGFPEFKTLSHNLTLLGHLYWKEFMSPENIFEAWGGAYDLIYQDPEGAFRYLDEYTIFLRLFDVDEFDSDIHLVNVLKYERRHDVSLITMLNKDELVFFGAKDITASDEPISMTANADLTMNSKVHMSIITMRKNKKYTLPLIQIDGLNPANQGKQTVFSGLDKDGRLMVFFNSEHDEWLKEQAMSLANF